MNAVGQNVRTRAILGYRGQQVLSYVERIIHSTGTPPSYAMIRDELRFCDDAAVCRAVQVLERRGFIRRIGAGRSRRIRLMQNNK